MRTGVNQKRELIGLWREHDSTGLRAETKLKHTALAVRVARKHTRSQRRFRDDTAKLKMGSRQAPHFSFLGGVALGRCVAAMMVIARAMLAPMPGVRCGSAGGGILTIAAGLRSRILRSLPRRGKKRRRQSQHQNTRYLFH